jgi:lysozyme family protein
MPLAACVFDIYVNHGPSTAKMLLLDTVDWREVIKRRKEFRAKRVTMHPPSERFLKGWIARDNDLSKFCQIWENDHAV